MGKREIKEVKVDEVKVTTHLKSSNMGRPIKFKKPIAVKVNMSFTDGQSEAIDKRMQEEGFTVRLDYIRSLFSKDIKDFNDL